LAGFLVAGVLGIGLAIGIMRSGRLLGARGDWLRLASA
jgi:hypothetical protein